MTQRLKFLFLLLLLGTVAVHAQSSDSETSALPPQGPGVSHPSAADPVADVRDHQRWEMGPFVNYGNGFGNRDQFRFFSAGFELGKVITPVVHAGLLSGQFEYAGNIMPLWMAFTPAAHSQLYDCGGRACYFPVGGGNFHGASLTPVILRWNFLTHSRRIQPWFQAAGGLIYTTHKFPPDVLVVHGKPGGTSVFNFSPQGGGGIHYFIAPRRSIDLGVNGVHISSASLGDKNPGVNASIQIQVGYTLWK